MEAFARAQKLLSRKEDLDDLPPMAPLSSMQDSNGKPSPKRRPAASKPPAAKRPPAPRQPALPAHEGPLPSLSQLATEEVGQEIGMLQKAKSPQRKPLRPRAPPEESRKAALSAMDSAMPSLDEDSAQLIAKARALLEAPPDAPAASVPGRLGAAPPRRPARRPSSSAALHGVAERSSAAGGGAAAAARIRAVPQTAPASEFFAGGYGGGGARSRDPEEMQEAARERVRRARLERQQRETEAELEARRLRKGLEPWTRRRRASATSRTVARARRGHCRRSTGGR